MCSLYSVFFLGIWCNDMFYSYSLPPKHVGNGGFLNDKRNIFVTGYF